MYYVLGIFAIVSLVASQPIDTVRTDPNASPDEIIYVPYSIKYVPIEFPTDTEKSTKNEELITKLGTENADKPLKLNSDLSGDDIKILPIEALEEKLKDISKPFFDNNDSIKQKQLTTAQDGTINQFEQKINSDLPKSSEDYVLVPISVLKKLEESSASGRHIINKRQAPGRRIFRRPALVGYLNEYDLFPTVA